MDFQMLFSLPIACAVALVFLAYKRRARRRRNLEIMRNRILFGISGGDAKEGERVVVFVEPPSS